LGATATARPRYSVTAQLKSRWSTTSGMPTETSMFQPALRSATVRSAASEPARSVSWKKRSPQLYADRPSSGQRA